MSTQSLQLYFYMILPTLKLYYTQHSLGTNFHSGTGASTIIWPSNIWSKHGNILELLWYITSNRMNFVFPLRFSVRFHMKLFLEVLNSLCIQKIILNKHLYQVSFFQNIMVSTQFLFCFNFSQRKFSFSLYA